MGNLFNYQYDFIKVKTQKINRESVNWEMLNEHPTIKNAYTLDARSGLHGKNFKLYFTKDDCAILETSIPYLKQGHNFIEMPGEAVKVVMEKLQQLLNIDLMNAEVKQLEYGCFSNIEGNAKDYIKKIKAFQSFDLNFSSAWMKMFGNGRLNFKIYDAVQNAKKKKTYSLGNYPNEGLIKYELKILNLTKFLNDKLYLKQLCDSRYENEFKEALNISIDELINNLIVIKLHQNTFTLSELMYLCLETLQEKFEYNSYNLIMEIIDMSNLTPSQKSKRRKAFLKLKNKLTQVN